MSEFYVGRRVSFGGALCTVHYYGPIDGRSGDWLGVEWDESLDRGRNDGSLQGKSYFRCLSDSSTAASFVRPTRPSDKPLSFPDALKEKYVSNESFGTALSEDQIKIGGRTVEEVGFEKIRQQLAILQKLRFVFLDGLRIAGIANHPGEKALSEWEQIRSQELSIVELDLSRNLLEQWSDIVGICAALQRDSLRTLKLDGNLFRTLDRPDVPEWADPFPKLAELSLSATYFSWSNMVQLLPDFPSLAILNLSANGLSTLQVPLPSPHLTTLDLSSNKIVSLWDIAPLMRLSNLQKLSLRHNPISSLITRLPEREDHILSFPGLKSLDLASTLLPTLSSLDPIPTIFPALTSLLTTNAPLTSFPSSKLLTIARIPTLTELNYSPVTTAERQNAELYYLSTVAKQLGAASNPAEESQIVNKHPQWTELCKIHGEPAIGERSAEQYASGTLGARVTDFTFYMTATDLEIGRKEAQEYNEDEMEGLQPHKIKRKEAQEYEGDKIEGLRPHNIDQKSDFESKSKLIPHSVDIYRLKGIVARLFSIRPMSCKLIWETGEWDPAGGQEDEGWSISEDETEDGLPSNGATSGKQDQNRDQAKWERRETELVDGTREIGFWVEGRKAKVRVELR